MKGQFCNAKNLKRIGYDRNFPDKNRSDKLYLKKFSDKNILKQDQTSSKQQKSQILQNFAYEKDGKRPV